MSGALNLPPRSPEDGGIPSNKEPPSCRRSSTSPFPISTGKHALVTGASDGVGFEIAARLARAGADILMPVRNPAEGRGRCRADP